jgi:glycosyltransferase involved in cell wall biosynthesis
MNWSGDGETVDFENLDVAVAHWHVNAWGGAEYLVTKLAEAVEVDRVYTLGDPDPDEANPYGDVTFVDVTPHLDYSAVRRLQRRAGRVFEYAQWEDVDWRTFGDPDVIITSGATARSVITPDDTLHLNYCHSPPRWYYDLYHDRKESVFGVVSRPLIRYLRTRDMAIDPRVDRYVVNSPIIKRRLWKYYKRESEILYPPVEVERYYNDGDHGFYLHLGRLDEEKGIIPIFRAFQELGLRLVMAGGAGDVGESVLKRIERAHNTEWRGFVDEDEKFELLARCSAVVFNGRNEDFGIVPIEANASGKPVISRDDGFPRMFVEEGRNGVLHDGTERGIRQAIDRVRKNEMSVTGEVDVSQFSFEIFSKKIRELVKTSHTDLQNRVR